MKRALDCLLPLLYFPIAALLAYPLFRHPFSQVARVAGDNLEYIWKLWWFKHSLLDLHKSPFIAPQVMYPHGYPLALGEMTPSFTLLGVPFTALLGPIAAYNLLVWLSFPIAAIGMYLLVAQHTEDRWARFIAGLLYAFAPFHFGHSFGHLPLMGIMWGPFLLWAAERTIATRRLTWAAASGVFYALTALSSWYLAVIFGFGLLVFVTVRAKTERRALFNQRARQAIGVFAIVVLVPMTPFVREYLLVTLAGRLIHSPGEMERWSAGLLDFVLPNPWHPLWGTAFRQAVPPIGNWAESGVALGYAAIALILLVRRWRGPALAYAVLGGVGLLLALGPTLHLLSNPTGLPMPGRLFSMLPILKLVRAMSRFAILASLGAAGLAGLGFARFAENRKGWKRTALGLAVAILVLFEFAASPPAMTDARPDPADRWLAAQPGQFTVVWVPSLESWNARHLLGSATHGKRLYGGYTTFLPDSWLPSYALLDRFPDPQLLDYLGKCDVRYILVRPAQYGARWPEIQAGIKRSPSLHLAQRSGDAVIYELAR